MGYELMSARAVGGGTAGSADMAGAVNPYHSQREEYLRHLLQKTNPDYENRSVVSVVSRGFAPEHSSDAAALLDRVFYGAKGDKRDNSALTICQKNGVPPPPRHY